MKFETMNIDNSILVGFDSPSQVIAYMEGQFSEIERNMKNINEAVERIRSFYNCFEEASRREQDE